MDAQDRVLSGAELAASFRDDRVKKRKTVAKDTAAGWETIDFRADRFECRYVDPARTFAMLDFRRDASMLDIFLRLWPGEFTAALVARRVRESPGVFHHSGKAWQLTLRRLTQAVAIFIRVQGLQVVPTEANLNTSAALEF